MFKTYILIKIENKPKIPQERTPNVPI